MVPEYGWRRMSQSVRFQQTLRRLAILDEAFVEDEARLGLDQAGTSALDPKTAPVWRRCGRPSRR
jgi:acyl transferase domain-containing protein